MTYTPHNSTQNPIQTARKKLYTVLNTLDKIVIGHETENKLLMLTLVAKEHAVMISPPGTAKTYTIKTLAQLLNAKFYKYLLTRFTSDVEILGPFDIKSLRENGVLRRNWSKIVEAEIVFLDEIFKANSSILNALLSLLQERILYDPMTGQEIPAKLWSCFGASNEVPTEEELQALYDRFAIRIFFDYLSDDSAILMALHQKYLNHITIQPVASMNDVKTIHDYAMVILSSTIKQFGDKPFVDIYHINTVSMIKELRSKGFIVSDRTIIEKLPKLVASYCALYGLTADNVLNAVFDILPHVASRDRREFSDVKKYITESLGEVGELVEKLERARGLIRAGDLKQALDVLKEILDFDLNTLASKPWLKPRAEAVLETARKYYEKVQQQLELLKKMAES